MKQFIIGLCIALALFSPEMLAEQVMLGQTAIQFSVPTGYKRVTPESDPEMYYFYRKRAYNEFLTVLAKPESHALWDKTIQFEVPSDIKHKELSRDDFNNLRQLLNKDFSNVVETILDSEAGKRKISQIESLNSNSAGMPVKFEAPLFIPIGVFIDTQNVWAGMQYTKGNFQAEGVSIPFKRIVSTSVLFLKGKVLFVYTSFDYKDETDIQNLKNFTKDYTYNLVMRNSSP